jgi:hypothetical protein
MGHRAFYKSQSVEFLDAFYRDGGADAVATAQGLLAAPGADASTVASQWAGATGFDPGELDGFRSRWLDEDGALGAYDVDRVLRYAYRAALELAAAHDPVVGLETFWVLGAGDEFEVHIHDGVDRITMFMVLPVTRRYGSRRATTSSHVVRVGDAPDVDGSVERVRLSDDGGEPVLMIQVSGPLPG